MKTIVPPATALQCQQIANLLLRKGYDMTFILQCRQLGLSFHGIAENCFVKVLEHTAGILDPISFTMSISGETLPIGTGDSLFNMQYHPHDGFLITELVIVGNASRPSKTWHLTSNEQLPFRRLIHLGPPRPSRWQKIKHFLNSYDGYPATNAPLYPQNVDHETTSF